MKEGSGLRIRHMPGGGRRVLFIHGYGGNLGQPGVKWFMNRFREHGLDMTYVQLPTEVGDIQEEVIGPVREVEKRLGTHVAVGFSFGGLVLSYLDGARKRIFLSPFWGVNDRWMIRGTESVVKLLSVITKPVLPRRFGREEAGPLAAERDMKGIPEHVSFRTIDQFFRAQRQLPPSREGDVVFYSPDDKVISLSAIENRDIETHRFRGGHMFYLSRERAEIMERVLSQVDMGFGHTHSAS